MGFFKKVKKFVSKQVKSAIKHPLATAAGIGLSAAIGPAGFGLTTGLTAAGAGSAASALLSGGLKRRAAGGGAEASGVPSSPFEGVTPITQDAALRAQSGGQLALGGGVAGTMEGDGDLLAEDEIKKRRASRVLLG